MSDPVWMALIAATPVTVVGLGQIWLGYRLSAVKRDIKADVETTKSELKTDVHNLHKEVNGRMTDLIAATEKAATATGRAEGVASEQAKQS